MSSNPAQKSTANLMKKYKSIEKLGARVESSLTSDRLTSPQQSEFLQKFMPSPIQGSLKKYHVPQRSKKVADQKQVSEFVAQNVESSKSGRKCYQAAASLC